MIELNREQIITLFDFQTAIESIKQAYIATSAGQAQVTSVGHLAFPEANGEAHIKSGYIAGTDSYVVKIASGFYDNAQRELSSSNGMMLAFSATTGQPLAILHDEGWLTDIRTALGGTIATMALAKKMAKQVLVVGTGIQARLHIECLHRATANAPLDFSIWSRQADRSDALQAELSQKGIAVTATRQLKDAIGTADIIITTTPARQALFEDAWVQAGTHITAIGADSPDKQELPSELVLRATLRVCDQREQSLEHGEFSHAYAIKKDALAVIALGDVLSGHVPVRRADDDISIVDLTGIATQDVAIAQTIMDAHCNQYTSTAR